MANDESMSFEIKVVSLRHMDGSASLCFAGRRIKSVSADYMARFRPKPGGRWLRLEDGSESYAPPATKDKSVEFEINQIRAAGPKKTFLYDTTHGDRGAEVTAEYIAKWKPEPGGTYIRFVDGTEFYRPPVASEEKSPPKVERMQYDESTAGPVRHVNSFQTSSRLHEILIIAGYEFHSGRNVENVVRIVMNPEVATGLIESLSKSLATELELRDKPEAERKGDDD